MTVYFIGSPTGHVKIGFTTKTAKRRLADLQTGSAVPLRVLAQCPGGRPEEQALHRILADMRCDGEWFQAEAKLLSLIDFVKKNRSCEGWVPPTDKAIAEPETLAAWETVAAPLLVGWPADWVQHEPLPSRVYGPWDSVLWLDRDTGQPSTFNSQRTVTATARFIVGAVGDPTKLACIWIQAAIHGFRGQSLSSWLPRAGGLLEMARKRYPVGFHSGAHDALPIGVRDRAETISASRFIELLAQNRDDTVRTFQIVARHAERSYCDLSLGKAS